MPGFPRHDLGLFKHMAGPNILPADARFPTETLHVDHNQFEEPQIDFHTVRMSESLPRILVPGFMAPNTQEREQDQDYNDESHQLQRGARYIR